jgi:glycosyltransferase involved in cell wall biosynthesis
MKTCAVVICAYDCAEFIQDLLSSLHKQLQTPGWIYNIRIGVDHCEKTAAVLKKFKQSYYMAEKNVGHGILRNALIYQAPADMFSYFDADDVMYPRYLKTQIEFLDRSQGARNIVMPAKINTDIHLHPKNGRPVVENGGAMTFTRRVIETIGGFQLYRCAIDTDFLRRVEMAGFRIHELKEALYYRRSHPKALTRTVGTGMKSAYRKRVWAEMTMMRKNGIIKIKPILVKLKKQ